MDTYDWIEQSSRYPKECPCVHCEGESESKRDEQQIGGIGSLCKGSVCSCGRSSIGYLGGREGHEEEHKRASEFT